jgi:hypothetical protein
VVKRRPRPPSYCPRLDAAFASTPTAETEADHFPFLARLQIPQTRRMQALRQFSCRKTSSFPPNDEMKNTRSVEDFQWG